ncbi:MAG: superinfection immunity protein [Gammaproteobacteria bacterium]|nr:superinfection immunity protein [Gammaproteobacteria bacterium]
MTDVTRGRVLGFVAGLLVGGAALLLYSWPDGLWYLGGVSLLVLACAVYGLPAIVAQLRHHHQRHAILVLNLLLGWTFFGWVVALVWAATAVRRDTPGSSAT